MIESVATKSTVVPRISYKSSALVAAELGRICVVYWRKTPTRETFNYQKAAVDGMVAKYGSNVGVICVVEPTTDPPDEQVRKASSKMITDHGTAISGVALVIEGNGFRAAITRTVLSGITFMIRTPVPIKFFVTPKEATAWVVPRTKQVLTPEFTAQVEQIRSHFPRE